MAIQNTNSPLSDHEAVTIPMPPELFGDTHQEMDVYARFMRHLRHVPNSRTSIKILSTIQFTADMVGLSDEHVAKILVDLGLRAPRMAFPASFLDFIDSALMRNEWDIGGPSKSMQELCAHWDTIGEDKFAPVRRTFKVLSEEAYS